MASLSCTGFLRTLFMTLLSFLKSTGTVFNLSISNSSPSDFKLAKSTFLVKSNVSYQLFFV